STGRASARRLPGTQGAVASAARADAVRARTGADRSALRTATRRVRCRPGRGRRWTVALAAGDVRTVVSGQAAQCAGDLPAPREHARGAFPVAGRTAGQAGRFAAADERQRPAAVECTVETRPRTRRLPAGAAGMPRRWQRLAPAGLDARPRLKP